MEMKTNRHWDSIADVEVSIITPVYNRRKELPRALVSIEKQTYCNFELIVVDDGSTEFIDDVMAVFMDRVTFPVAFIKKENGGVHTARNAGIRISRGKYYTQLDSDDELPPDSLKLFIDAWNSIPSEHRNEYREVVGFCEDQNGNRIGGHLPVGINELPFDQAKKMARLVEDGEKLGMLRGDIMRNNLWPEPEGVTFVAEGLNWLRLGYQYKSWFIDDIVRIYHMETEVSYTNVVGKRSDQKLVNELYNMLWFVNNGKKYGMPTKMQIEHILRYNMVKQLLRWRKVVLNYQWAKEGIISERNRICSILLWLPSIAAAYLSKYKHSE